MQNQQAESRRSHPDLPDQPGQRAAGIPSPARTATAPFVGTNFGRRSAEWWDPNLRNPYVMNWHTSIQYEFTRDYLVEVSYQGSGGVGLVERWQNNTFPIDYGAGNPALQSAGFRGRRRITGRIRTWAMFCCAPTTATPLSIPAPSSWRNAFRRACSSTRSTPSRSPSTARTQTTPVPASRRFRTVRSRKPAPATTATIAGRNRQLRTALRRGQEVRSGERLEEHAGGRLGDLLDPDHRIRQPAQLRLGKQPLQLLPDVRRRPPARRGRPARYDMDAWNNGGPDRFVHRSVPQMVDINAFAWPGGCGNVTTVPAGSSRLATSASATPGGTTSPDRGLIWAQVSAQKNFRFTER